MKGQACDPSHAIVRAFCIVLCLVTSLLAVASPAGGAPSGAVVAWGGNTHGQTNVPIEARSGVMAIAVGELHSLALKDNGTVVAWGDNTWGQTNVPLEARTGVMAIAAGARHSVALKDNGTVVAWGDNSRGQTVVPAGLSGVKAIAAGGTHAVALKNDGTVVAWGDNFLGQTNVPIAARSGVVAIAAGGYNTIALKSDGTVVAWGINNWSQNEPPTGLSGVTAVAAGGTHALALKSDGSVVGWGSQSSIPFAARHGVKAISAASYFDNPIAYGLALKTNGSVVGWGQNSYGAAAVPSGLDEVIAIVAGSRHALAITLPGVPVIPATVAIIKPPADCSVYVGQNAFFTIEAEGYSLGYQWQQDGVAIAGATNATWLSLPATLANHEAAFTVVVSNPSGTVTSSPPAVLSVKAHPSGSVVAWGANDYGQTNIPVEAQSIVMAIDAGRFHGVALTTNGAVVAWGDNTYGQTEVPITARSGVVAIAAGWYHTAALKEDGSVVVWDLRWQPPVPVEAKSGVVAIAAGGYHTAALKSDGAVVAWGDNTSGQTDVPVAAQSGVVAIAAGGHLTVALKNDGSVVTWGRAGGLGGLPLASVPYDAQSGVVAISGGDDAVIVLKNDGTSVEWGGPNQVWTKPMEARSGLKAVSAGSQFLALKTNGSVLAWKENPPAPAGLRDVIAISSGYRYGLAITLSTNLPPGPVTIPPVITKPPANQSLYEGQNAAFIVEAQGLSMRYQWQRNGVAIAGATNFCFITLPVTPANDGDAFTVVVSNPAGTVTSSPPAVLSVKARPSGIVTWGSGYPVPVEAQSGVVAVAAGDLSLALKTNGSLVAWGGGYGQSFELFGLATRIAAGGSQAMALMTDGSVVVWSSPYSYTQTNVPGVVAIAAGSYHAAALKSDGSVVAWGFGFYGQTTVPVAAQSGVVAIAAGFNHTVALKSDGSVVAWGRLNYAPEPLGVLLGPQSPAVAIAAEGGGIVALKADGSVVAWGSQPSIPAAGQSGVKAISAGSGFTVALKTDGTLVAWGLNDFGQSTVPSDLGEVIAFAAGYRHAVALVAPGGPVPAPVISRPPVDQSVYVGQSAAFAVEVQGSRLSYQWYRSGVPIEGATNAFFLTPPVTLANDGDVFHVVVSNSGGSVTSSPPAMLSVKERPSGSVLDQSVYVGQNAAFAIETEGSGLSYQWYRSGVPIEGATSAFFLTPPVTLANDGDVFHVVVRDAAGSVTSPPPAVLSVKARPAGSMLPVGYHFDGQTNVPETARSGVIAIATGGYHNVVLKEDGTVVAWGNNVQGQTNVPPGLSGVTAIAAGLSFGMALKDDGTIVSWGQSPVPAGVTGVTAIAAGNFRAVALKNDGTVVSWGDPVPPGLAGVVAISAADGASYSRTLALKSDGQIVEWGYNTLQSRRPAGLTNVVAIAAGGTHNVALKNDGTVVVWGYFQTNQPMGLRDVTAIAAGKNHTVALKSDGTMVAWGVIPPGDYDYGATNVPVGLTDVTAIAAKGDRTLALVRSVVPVITEAPVGRSVYASATAALTVTAKGVYLKYQWQRNGVAIAGATNAILILPSVTQANHEDNFTVVVSSAGGSVTSSPPAVLLVDEFPLGTVLAWGENWGGQANVPQGLDGVKAIAAGAYHTVALKDDGTVAAWGAFAFGQTDVPADLAGVTAIAAGWNHTLALKDDGTVTAWGRNANGETSVPAGLTEVVAMAAGDVHSVVLRSDGTVLAWGGNYNGQTNVPAGLTGVAAIAAGGYHTVALKHDGTVVAWGDDLHGKTTPPAGLSGVMAIAAGVDHTMALKANGTVVAWGFNGYGQTAILPGLGGVIGIAAGLNHSLALKNDGTVAIWGRNDFGQSTVPSGLTGVVGIAAGNGHTAVLVKQGVQASPRVFLSVRPGGNGLILSWPGNAFSYVLQTTPDLTPPVTWTDWSGVPVVIGTQFTVTNPITNGRQFFRLVRP